MEGADASCSSARRCAAARGAGGEHGHKCADSAPLSANPAPRACAGPRRLHCLAGPGRPGGAFPPVCCGAVLIYPAPVVRPGSLLSGEVRGDAAGRTDPQRTSARRHGCASACSSALTRNRSIQSELSIYCKDGAKLVDIPCWATPQGAKRKVQRGAGGCRKGCVGWWLLLATVCFQSLHTERIGDTKCEESRLVLFQLNARFQPSHTRKKWTGWKFCPISWEQFLLHFVTRRCILQSCNDSWNLRQNWTYGWLIGFEFFF